MKKCLLAIGFVFVSFGLIAQNASDVSGFEVMKNVLVGNSFSNVKQKNWEPITNDNKAATKYVSKNATDAIPGFKNALVTVQVDAQNRIDKWEVKQSFSSATEAATLDVFANLQTHFSKLFGGAEVSQTNEYVWYGKNALLGIHREKNAQGVWVISCYGASLGLY